MMQRDRNKPKMYKKRKVNLDLARRQSNKSPLKACSVGDVKINSTGMERLTGCTAFV
jgi:hypothetical protein